MKIEIFSPLKTITLEFQDEAYFVKIHEEITESISDEYNVKGVYYEEGTSGMMLPALLLKNSIITVHKTPGEENVFITT